MMTLIRGALVTMVVFMAALPAAGQYDHEGLMNIAVKSAEQLLGTPYRYGGLGPPQHRGIDCSALIKRSFAAAGFRLPRRAIEQSRYQAAKDVPIDQLRRGDLLFFGFKETIDHVAVVTSVLGRNVRFLHASLKYNRVRYDGLSRKWKNTSSKHDG